MITSNPKTLLSSFSTFRSADIELLSFEFGRRRESALFDPSHLVTSGRVDLYNIQYHVV